MEEDRARQVSMRNSTADFLTFAMQDGAEGIQVFVRDKDVWLTQKAMATLFDCTVGNINKHLKAVIESGEVDEVAVIEEFSITATDGKRCKTKHYHFRPDVSREASVLKVETSALKTDRSAQ